MRYKFRGTCKLEVIWNPRNTRCRRSQRFDMLSFPLQGCLQVAQSAAMKAETRLQLSNLEINQTACWNASQGVQRYSNVFHLVFHELFIFFLTFICRIMLSTAKTLFAPMNDLKFVGRGTHQLPSWMTKEVHNSYLPGVCFLATRLHYVNHRTLQSHWESAHASSSRRCAYSIGIPFHSLSLCA